MFYYSIISCKKKTFIRGAEYIESCLTGQQAYNKLRSSNERPDPNGERSVSDKDVVSSGRTSVYSFNPV
jgi:hypothetical protein